MQAKRIQVNEGNDGVAGATSVALTVPTTPREEVNFHNIHGWVSAEPQTGDANAQYTWFLYILRENATNFVMTDVITNNETNNDVIIAMGVFSASNQTPYNLHVNPKTSRTLKPGDELRLQIVTTGITAGLSSNRVLLSAHTVRA